MALASTLKKLRMKKGKSLQDVADAVNASKAHIWELETGKSQNPSIDLLRRLANYYKTSVASLIGENPSTAENERYVSMFREAQELEPEDFRLLENMLKTLKESRKKKDGSDD